MHGTFPAGFIAWARSPCLGHSASQRQPFDAHAHAHTHTRALPRSAGRWGAFGLAALPRRIPTVVVAGPMPWPVRCRLAALLRRVAALCCIVSCLRCAVLFLFDQVDAVRMALHAVVKP